MLSLTELTKGPLNAAQHQVLGGAVRLIRDCVETEVQLLFMREFPIKVTSAVSNEVDAFRAEQWERVGQERSRDSCVPARSINHEQRKMGLDGTISLEVRKTHHFVVERRHDRNDAKCREDPMSPSSIFNVRCPAFSGPEVEYHVKINLFGRSEQGRTFHTFSFAPIVSQLVSMMTAWHVNPTKLRCPTRDKCSHERLPSGSPSTRTSNRESSSPSARALVATP